MRADRTRGFIRVSRFWGLRACLPGRTSAQPMRWVVHARRPGARLARARETAARLGIHLDFSTPRPGPAPGAAQLVRP